VGNPNAEERAARVRQARQVLAGNEVAPPEEPVGFGSRFAFGGSVELRYLLGVAALIVVAALVWALAGMGVGATVVFVVLALALLMGWFIL
jgi:Flp pilus assembly protein TadB